MKHYAQVKKNNFFPLKSTHDFRTGRCLFCGFYERHSFLSDFPDKRTYNRFISYSTPEDGALRNLKGMLWSVCFISPDAASSATHRFLDAVVGGEEASGSSSAAMECAFVPKSSVFSMVPVFGIIADFYDVFGQVLDAVIGESVTQLQSFQVRMKTLLDRCRQKVLFLFFQKALAAAVHQLGNHCQLILRRWNGVHSFYKSLVPIYVFSTLPPPLGLGCQG